MMTLPPPMLAEADFGQVIFVIVFLLVGFIQWVIKVIKEKAEAAERARRVPTQEELEARNRTWELQTRPAPTPPAPEPPPAFGGTLGDLLGEIRKAMEETPSLPTPPPLPPPAAAVRPVPVTQPAPKPDVATARTPVVHQAPAAVVAHRPIDTRRHHPATAMLHTAEGYRQAFILREVLGPPRAFHDFSGPED